MESCSSAIPRPAVSGCHRDSPSQRPRPCAALPAEFDHTGHGSEIKLVVEDIAALPTDVLRPRLDGGEYVIERYGYRDDPAWTERSRISRHYRNVDGRLTP